MAEDLVWQDYLTIGVYFAVVLAVGLWASCRPDRGSASGYFLAGKNMHWIPIGASIYASQIGAPMFVGLAGSAAANGFSVAIYEWHAVFLLIALGWIFVPVYVACGTYTMPEYLKKRFGGKRIRIYASVLSLVSYMLNNIAAEIYSGAIFMRLLLGWNIYISVSLILAITCIFTITGGLAAVLYTDILQSVVVIIGCTISTVLAFNSVGGWDGMMDKYMYAAANYTLNNQTFYKCGMPREDAFHIWRDATSGDIPWPGAVFGLTTLGMFAWCNDQLIVQRCLAAKHLGHAKAGSLLAGGLKLLGFLMFIVPGMISRILYPEDIACADPDTCAAFCGNKAGCTNLAYPVLVLRLLPIGLRSLMLAALMAALMSSLTSIFNSASSIITMDIWRQFRCRAGEAELMVVGRATVLVLACVSMLWLPVLQETQGGVLWFYLQAVRSYLLPPWCMVFLLGVFWKRLTEQGAFWGLMIGIVVGGIRLGLDFAIPAPSCGSDAPDERFAIVAKVDFLHFAIILAGTSAVCMVVISLFTNPRPPEKLHRVTWWTRDDKEEPDLTDDEDANVDEREMVELNEEERAGAERKDSLELDLDVKMKTNCYRLAKSWICGTPAVQNTSITRTEREDLRTKMTSLSDNRTWKWTVNAVAVLLSAITVAFLIYLG